MGLETGTFISDLVATNPLGTDVESQGANHLRLIKLLLQNTFPGASKAWPFPTSVVKTANYSVVKADFNTTFLADTTGGAFTFTLPTLVAGDATWSCQFMKTNAGVNPFFLAPPSGTISSGEITGLTKSRRAIPLRPTTAIWTGTQWVLTRVPGVPVGSMVPWGSGVLAGACPVGFEFPNGQTLSTANYPDYAAFVNVAGATIDARGRAFFAQDNLGGAAASRLTAGGGFDGTQAPGVGGGAQTVALIQDNLPNIQSTISGMTFTGNQQTVNSNEATIVRNVPSGGGGSLPAGNALSPNTQISVTFTPTGSVSGGNVAWPNIGQAGGTSFLGKGTAVQPLPPMVLHQPVLVVE